MSGYSARKYKILLNILDTYVQEGRAVAKRRRFFSTATPEDINQARSRAFIHLYLAATYGINEFEDREHIITDAGYDGGIDAYFIDTDRKRIDVIQAKFRTTPDNFEQKFIAPVEILKVDLDRILTGHREDEDGNKYNGYIQAFIDKIVAIPDIARYTSKITVLANVRRDETPLVERLFSGYETEIFDFGRCYQELVLPTLRGEQHYVASLRLILDLSNKPSSSKLSATIDTEFGPSEITVILVPTIEIASLMSRYKNSILRYNPRSYLEFREQRTNEGIRDSITETKTGEFAILNNGITIVSDETYLNEKVGAKNKAQVEIVSPQIINGGQTAFTLSRVYDDSSDLDRIALFDGKEVIVRIITLPQTEEASKRALILKISSATNSQTQVSNIDRTASNDVNREIADRVFEHLGLLFEPKRGEFSEAVHHGYIGRDQVIERSLFTRIYLIATGQYSSALQRKIMRKTGGVLGQVPDGGAFDKIDSLYSIYRKLVAVRPSAVGQAQITNDLQTAVIVDAIMRAEDVEMSTAIEMASLNQSALWRWAKENVQGYDRKRKDKNTGELITEFSIRRWQKSNQFPADVLRFAEEYGLLRPQDVNSPTLPD